MFCPKCGNEVPDGAKFCGKCGSTIESAAPATPSAAHAAAPAAAAAQVANAMPDAVKNITGDKKKLGIAIGAVVAVIVLIVVLVNVLGKPVSESDLKKSLENQSSLIQNGVVSSNYTTPSDYTLSDVKITKTEESKLNGYNNSLTVNFTAKLANESFESSLTGVAYYYKMNDKWQFGNYNLLDSETKPLKGVDNIMGSSSSSGSGYTVSDFESTLDESDGTYTSTATQTATYDYWFATDTAKNSRTFTFDQNNGWTTKEDVQVSDVSTTWKLADKSFTYQKQNSGSTYKKNTEATLTFGEATDGDSLSATYTLKFTPPANEERYSAVDLSGTATVSSKVTHEFGSSSFSIELNDSEHEVTFTCGNSSSSMVAGSGTVNTLSVYVNTNTASYTYYGGDTQNFEMSGMSFTENV